MKKSYRKGVVLLLAIVLLVITASFTNAGKAFAKDKWQKSKAELTVSSKTLYDDGETFELSLKYSGKDIKYITWYTQNDKVATINTTKEPMKAIVQSIRKGTTHVKCKITLNDGTVLRPACKITVKDTDIDITNEKKDSDGRHVMNVGETYQFTSKISPSDSRKNTYWYVDNEEYATVDSKGLVTAKNPGIVTLTAVAAYTKDGVWFSNIKDSITIKIVEKTPSYQFNPQAKILSIVRQNNLIVTTFDRAIQTPGLILVNNRTECIEGVVDPTYNTVVYYNMSSTASLLYGWQKIYIGYWEGFYVSPDDRSSDKLIEQYVDFSLVSQKPLPAPTSITQSDTNNNQVNLQFSSMLDEATAENINNYSISGATIVGAELINHNNGATVILTVKQNSITTTNDYLITIFGIKGYNNSYDMMHPYQTFVYLEENVLPSLTSIYYSKPTSILLTFNESLTGTASFKVMQNNVDIASYSIISGNTIVIVLKNTPTMNVEMKVIPTSNNSIKDYFGNVTDSILTRSITPN